MHLIIFAHPTHDSHSGEALKRLEKKLKKKGEKYEILDLYKMNFQAYLTESDLKKMKNKEKLEKDVLDIQEKINSAERLYFIYPVWWYGVPAILKGFMDRVITPGFAYRFKRINWFMSFGATILSYIPGVRYLLHPYSARGFLKNKGAVIIRTFGGPSFGARVFGNKQEQLDNCVLRFCGITRIKKVELFNVDKRSNTPAKEENFYQKVEDLVS